MSDIAKLLPFLVVALLLPAAHAYPESNYDWATKPAFVRGDIARTHYDGVSNDLLTAGLGKSGLADRQRPPGFADPKKPTAEELRKLAIYANYRAIVDTSPGGGYGEFFGPNVDANGNATSSEGLVAGDEFIAFADDGSGRQNVTMLVQVPDRFDPANACIVTAPSSGSRGVYGAIATGEWGLKHNCAVAYVDKGGGTGAHDLSRNTVNLIRGERVDAAAAGNSSTFTAALDARQRAAFMAERPHRFAFKHAHSQHNPEKDWGRNVLQSIEFAFYVLNQKFSGSAESGRRITRRSTIVIASSISNGGGASLRAAEQDRAGLIDALVVAEPNVNPRFDPRFAIVQDGNAPFREHSRSLIDYTTYLNIFQGCASVANADAPFNDGRTPKRCEALHALGLLRSTTLAEQADEAQHLINEYGILPEQNAVQPSHWSFYVPQSIAVTYANAYGRFSVADGLCRYSFAATDTVGAPAELALNDEAILFATSGGLPPTALSGGVRVINDDAPGGPRDDPKSTPDQNLPGALCLRGLATGRDPVTGNTLEGDVRANHDRIAYGIEEIRADGNLRGLPAMIVTGRSDAILALNHASRAYFGLNKLVEGDASQLHYVEVTNAHHLDVFNGLPGFNTRYVPLHRYHVQAMDLMLDHLKRGTPLPPSQVVRTKARGTASDGTVPPLDAASVPPILSAPSADALITFTSGEVRIPN